MKSRSHQRNRGAAMLAVLAFTIVGGVAVTAWTYLLAARVIQASRLGDSVVRHITWGNNDAINRQYSFDYTYRYDVSQPELAATVSGGGGQVTNAFNFLRAFSSINTYSNPSGFAAPFNNIRKQITSDNSVYYTRTTASSDASQTEHLLYYNFQKTYPRSLLGDLLIVHAKPSGAGSTFITDNLKVSGRTVIYDSGADISGVESDECLNLTKTGTNSTLNASATSTLLPQNFPSRPVFTAGSASASTGAVLDGSLNVLNNANFTVNSLYDKMIASSTGYWDLSTSNTSGNNIKSTADSGSATSDVWIKDFSISGPGSTSYPPPTTSPYNYDPGTKLQTATILLKSATQRHIHVISGVEQLVLQGQINASDYTSATSLAPLIILVEQEIRDIRLVGECSRPIILGVGTGTGQTLYMSWSGSSTASGGGPLRWRLHLINQYRDIYINPPSGNNVNLIGSIRTNWNISCTDLTPTDRFFLSTESSPGTLVTLLPRDGWFEPLVVQ